MGNFNYDITEEIQAIQNSTYGIEVRQSIVDALTKLNTIADRGRSSGGGNMFKLEDFPAYNKGLSGTDLTEVIRDAVAYAKDAGYSGILFPKDETLIIDVDATTDPTTNYHNHCAIPIPSNFGVDLNNSTVKLYRRPTEHIENIQEGPYGSGTNSILSSAGMDTRKAAVFGMLEDYSFLRNGIIDGGLSEEIVPEYFTTSYNNLSVTGVIMEGSFCKLEGVTIQNTLSDALRIDNGSSAAQVYGDPKYERAAMIYAMKKEDFHIGSDGCSLVSRWLRISGGNCKASPTRELLPGQVTGRDTGVSVVNARSTDFIENDVVEFSFRYDITNIPSKPDFEVSPFYEIRFTDDETIENTWNDPSVSAHLFKGKYQNGIATDANKFPSVNPLGYDYVSIPDGTPTDPDKAYYILNSDGEYVRVLEPAATSSGYYKRKAKLPMFQIVIPCGELSSIDEFPPRTADGEGYVSLSVGTPIDPTKEYYRKIGDEYVRIENPGTVSQAGYYWRRVDDCFGYSEYYIKEAAYEPKSSRFVLRGITKPCANNHVTDIIIKHGGRNGITLGTTHNTIISNFIISSCYYQAPYAGIDIEEGNMYCYDNTIQDGYITQCDHGICGATSQRNIIKNVIITNCSDCFYSESAKSLTFDHCTFIQGYEAPNNIPKEQDGRLNPNYHLRYSDSPQTLIVQVMNRLANRSETTRTVFTNCTFYGSVIGLRTSFDNCYFKCDSIFLDGDSIVTGCKIRPSTAKGNIRLCGSFDNCRMSDFNSITYGTYYSRYVRPSISLTKFTNCVFTGYNVDFTLDTFADSPTYSSHLSKEYFKNPKPIEIVDNCIFNVTRLSGIVAKRITNCYFDNYSYTVYTSGNLGTYSPLFYAEMISNCVFAMTRRSPDGNVSYGYKSGNSNSLIYIPSPLDIDLYDDYVDGKGVVYPGEVSQNTVSRTWKAKEIVIKDNVFIGLNSDITKNQYQYAVGGYEFKPNSTQIAYEQKVHMFNNVCLIHEVESGLSTLLYPYTMAKNTNITVDASDNHNFHA